MLRLLRLRKQHLLVAEKNGFAMPGFAQQPLGSGRRPGFAGAGQLNDCLVQQICYPAVAPSSVASIMAASIASPPGFDHERNRDRLVPEVDAVDPRLRFEPHPRSYAAGSGLGSTAAPLVSFQWALPELAARQLAAVDIPACVRSPRSTTGVQLKLPRWMRTWRFW
jgi:hypothetical protein